MVFALVFASIALQIGLIDQARSDQPPVQHWLALLVIFDSLGAHAERRRAIVAGAVGGGVLVAGDLVDLLFGGGRPEDTVPAWFLLAAAYGVGFALRGQRIRSTLLAHRAERLELEREQKARLAVAEERVRIARELHDIVAHAISMIVVQAQAGQRVLEGEQASAREALGSIETTGRGALVEMRRLLGVLRREDRELALAPATEPGDLDARRAVREAGLPVELRVGARRAAAAGRRPVRLPDRAGGADQRAQARRAGRRARSSSATARASSSVEVTDDGRAPAAAPATAGHGLVGMRERVALVGGTLEAGARRWRGYAVHARLPLARRDRAIRVAARRRPGAGARRASAMCSRREPDIEVVGEAADGARGRRARPPTAPDVVLMDIRMPRLDGIEATRAARRRPGPACLILTTFDLDEYVYEALRAGASGFLLKDAPAGRAGRPRSASSPRARRCSRRRSRAGCRAVRPPPRRARRDRPSSPTLTARELDVLRLVARGLSNAEIAGRRCRQRGDHEDPRAPESSQKLGLRDRVQAVVLAYESGLLQPGKTDGGGPR